MNLNELSDAPGARKSRARVGRGIASGKGKTCGRGVKGQKSRSGVSGIRQFEGGQMPLYMRLPKRGFNSPGKAEYAVVNVGRLQKAIDAGKLDASGVVDAQALVSAGVVRRVRDGVRLLGRGSLSAKVDIVVVYASPGAVTAVEAAGGSVSLVKKAGARVS